MEALAGLSVAANVMQVIDFTHDTVTFFTKVYRDGTTDPNLIARVAKIETLAQSLEMQLSQSATALDQSPKPSIKSRLPTLCKEVITTAKELKSRLSQPTGSKRGAFKSTMKMKFGRELSKIAELDNKLHQLEQILQTELLVEIWSKEDAATIQQQKDFKTLDQGVKDLIQQYAQGQINMREVLREDRAAAILKMSKDLQASLSVGFNKTTQHVTEVVQSTEHIRAMRSQEEQLIRALSFPSRNARKSAVKQAHEKTFEWVFKAPDADEGSRFRKWATSDEDPVFWIRGKPGSGKSTLMKFLVSDQRTVELLNLRNQNTVICSHFVWMVDKTVDGTLRGMLCSLILQLLEIDADSCFVLDLIHNHPEYQYRLSPNDWEMDELQTILKELIDLHEGFVGVFIDGLDELVKSEDKLGLRDYLKHLLSEFENLKVCVSSRPEPEEKLLFHGIPSIELQKLTKNDLEVVAQDNLYKYFDFALRQISTEEREELISLIVQKADGVFLWVTLALTRLKKGAIACATVDQLVQCLQDTPSELKDLYHEMWDRQGSEYKQQQRDAAFVFRCLLLWKRVAWEMLLFWESSVFMSFGLMICRETPSTAVFTELINRKLEFYRSQNFLDACITNQRQVESCCAGLIEFFEQDRIGWKSDLFDGIDSTDCRVLGVDFIHRSLSDFLLEDGQSLLDQTDEETVYAAVFRACIGETMITSATEKAGFNVVTSMGPFGEPSPFGHIKDEGPKRYPIDSEVYQNYRMSNWSPKHHQMLGASLRCLRRWMQNSKKDCLEKRSRPSLWDTQYAQNLKLLKDAFQAHKMPNFMEQTAIHLHILPPDIEDRSTLHSLSTYLIWQRLDGTDMGHHRYGSFEDLRTFEMFKQANMSWAYPHMVAAAGHAIPQLMTLPETIIMLDLANVDHDFVLLRCLKQVSNMWMIGSSMIIDDLGGCLGTQCGVFLMGFEPEYPEEYYEVIFRANAAFFVNRYVHRILESVCPYRENSWNLEHQNELKDLLCPSSEEAIEVLVVGKFSESFNNTSDPTVVFNPVSFEHIHHSWAHPFDTYKKLFRDGFPRYYRPSEAQSDAISSQLDPDFLMRHCMGPYDTCFCKDCTNEQLLDVESKENLDRLKQRRKDRVSAIKTVIDEMSSESNERLFNIPEHLRFRGHYVPTESDLLEFVEAESTLKRIEVLERLNQEKAEKEKCLRSGIQACKDHCV